MRSIVSAAFFALAAPALADPPSPVPATSASPSTAPSDAPSPVYVHGQVLTISGGYLIFTSGDAVRTQSGLVAPAGVRTGSYVRVTIDRLARSVTAIELEPKITLAGEIDASKIPREYVAVSPKSAPLPAPSAQSAGAASGLVSVTILAHIPGNTPATDAVYLSTDRSSYNPSEVPMQRIDGTTFSVSVSLPAGTTLKYEFTRGTYATVERDRTGGIVPPRVLNAAPKAKTDDTVARWADLS